MDFDIEPNVGVRGLPIGSTKGTVREVLGDDPKVFRRSPNDNPADHWSEAGVFAYYDGAGRLEALEFASPANAKLHGKVLTEASMEEATAFLTSLDPDLRVEEAGASIHSSQLGIGLWCPTPGERGAMVEAVLVCGPGYFD